jgi:hypothetical protein
MALARRMRTGRARGALLWGLLVFAAGQLATAVALEHALPGVRDAEYAAKTARLRTLLQQAPGRPLVLVLGSSRTMMNFDAGRAEAQLTARSAVVFNFGMRGAGPMLELVFLRRLLADGLRPDLILLEVLPPVFNGSAPHPLEQLWLNGGRLRLSELSRLRRYHTEPGRLVRHWLKNRWAPCSSYSRELRGALGTGLPEAPPAPDEPCPGELDPHGWQPYFVDGVTAEQRRTFSEVARAQYSESLGPFQPGAQPLRALDDLVALCRREGIALAFVLMPESSTFRALYPEGMVAGLERHLKGCKDAEGMPLVDARAWVDDSGFWDGHHALPTGARAFTDRLSDEVLQPLLLTLVSGRQRHRVAAAR